MNKEKKNVKPQANLEEADTGLIVHSCEAVAEGYERQLVMTDDTEVLLLLQHYVASKAAEVWTVSGTAKKLKCNAISDRLSEPARENLFGLLLILVNKQSRPNVIRITDVRKGVLADLDLYRLADRLR